MEDPDSLWYTRFQVVAEGDSDGGIVWSDVESLPSPPRQPSQVDRLSILLIGIVGIGMLVAMAAALVIGAYLSRR